MSNWKESLMSLVADGKGFEVVEVSEKLYFLKDMRNGGDTVGYIEYHHDIAEEWYWESVRLTDDNPETTSRKFPTLSEAMRVFA